LPFAKSPAPVHGNTTLLASSARTDGRENYGHANHDRHGIAHSLANGCSKARAARSLTFVLPAIGAGGSEHVIAMLCNHFAAQGCGVRLVCFAPPGTKPFYDLHPSVVLVCLGADAEPRGAFSGTAVMLKRFRLLRQELRRHRPDVAISFLTRTNVLTAIAARWERIPVIVSERNNPQRQTIGRVWSWLRRKAYARADVLVTMTRGAGSYFEAAPGRLDLVIPNHARFPEEARAFDPSGRHLVAVGRLVDQKGFDLLLQAFASLAPQFPDWRLTIWGEGPLRGALEAQRSALGLDDRVGLPGVTTEPGGWTADADIFVISSRYEGWGLVVGEAMAAGIPTVAFDCPWGPGEMIVDGRTGMLAPDQDVPGLTAALARLMADASLRKTVGEAGRESMKRFLPDAILEQWDDLVTKVAATRCGSRQEQSR
jgi:glycosyltransferase involved in cell wall biosynthesis